MSLKIEENLLALAQSYHSNARKIVMLFMDLDFGIMPFKLAAMGQHHSNLNDISTPPSPRPHFSQSGFPFYGKLVLNCNTLHTMVHVIYLSMFER